MVQLLNGKTEQILRSIRRIIRSTDLYSHRMAAEHGITVPQLLCLQTIVEFDQLSAGDLARSVDLSQSTCVGIVDRLAGRGLVERTRDARDRRKVRLRATPRGRDMCEQTPSLLQDALVQGLAALSSVEQDRIIESLKLVVQSMRAEHIDAAPVLDTGIRLNLEADVEGAGRRSTPDPAAGATIGEGATPSCGEVQ